MLNRPHELQGRDVCFFGAESYMTTHLGRRRVVDADLNVAGVVLVKLVEGGADAGHEVLIHLI